jgi:hypothetical protein
MPTSVKEINITKRDNSGTRAKRYGIAEENYYTRRAAKQSYDLDRFGK